MSENCYIAAPGGARILLETETIEDCFGNVVVRHEYPHADGADLERMGQKAREVRLKAIFWDEPGYIGYDNHRVLITLLDYDQLELTHPVYGLIKGMAENINVRHDDNERYAEVDFNFLEQGRDRTVAVQVVDVAAAMEGRYRQALLEELARIEANARLQWLDLLNVSSDLDIPDVDLGDVPPGESILGFFTGVSRGAWNLVKQVDSAVRTLEGTLLEVAVPANSLISSIDFATNLPGRLLGSVARCVERYATLGATLRGAPYRFVDSMKSGLLLVETSMPEFGTHVRAVGAARACLALGDIFSADDQSRRTNEANRAGAAFDDRGRRIPAAAPEPVLTVGEMENAAALVRDWVQTAVEADRSRTELKAMALDLMAHLTEVKVQREKLVAVEIDQEMPLHLVCLKYGLPYRDAERLLAVNRLRRPNFVRGEVLVYG